MTLYFASLLCKRNVLEGALGVLTSYLLYPVINPDRLCRRTPTIERRYRVWQARNQNALSFAIRDLGYEILVSDMHDRPTKSFEAVYRKVYRDFHLQNGMDVVRQLPIDEERDYDREFASDHSAKLVSSKLL